MSEKKRKRASDTTELSKKKAALDSAHAIKIEYLTNSNHSNLVIATSPGLSLPKDLKLNTYFKTKAHATNLQSPHELLLHSSSHSVIDYTGRERQDAGAEGLLTHYIGIFDPDKNILQVVEARKMVLRGTVRTEDEEMRQRREKQGSMALAQRRQLASEFGTKKARKAIDALAENTITPMKKKVDTHAEAQKAVQSNPAAAAVLTSMALSAENFPDKEAIQAAIDKSKPRPTHNPNATNPKEVYPIESLIGTDALTALDIKDWLEKGRRDEPVLTPFKFISGRLGPVVKSAVETKDVGKVRALKYMFHLMRFNAAGDPMKSGGKKLKPRAQLEKATGMHGPLLDSILERFAAKGDMTKWHVDNLMTHIVALSLVVDDFESDTYHLREDLKLKPIALTQYFHEIGVRLIQPTEFQRTKMGIHKADKTAHKIAKLSLPLDFPKARTIPIANRR